MRLTEQQKLQIIEKYKNGNCTCSGLAREYSCDPSTINAMLRKNNVKINNNWSQLMRKYTLDESYFNKIDTEEKAYFLGLLYADGHNSLKTRTVRISLQEQDKLILEKLNLSIKSNKPLNYIDYGIKKPKWKNQYQLNICSGIVANQLVELGCFPNKSLTLKFPTNSQVPDHLLNHFVRGYSDGDGCISFGYRKKILKAKASLVSTSYFCDSAKKIIEKLLNIHCGIYSDGREKKNKVTKTLSIGGNKQVLKYLNWLYQDATVYIDRKYNQYLRFKTLYI